LHHHRHLALRQVELGQPLVVVAGGGDAQGVGDGGRGDAEVGGAREVGAHDQLGRTRLAVEVTLPMPGRVRSSRSTFERGRPARAVVAGQHQHVLLGRAAEADLDAHPAGGQRLAQLGSMACLVTPGARCAASG
jgi:hypothetical protein